MTPKKNNIWHYLFRKEGFGRTYWIEAVIIFAAIIALTAVALGAWHQRRPIQLRHTMTAKQEDTQKNQCNY